MGSDGVKDAHSRSVHRHTQTHNLPLEIPDTVLVVEWGGQL